MLPVGPETRIPFVYILRHASTLPQCRDQYSPRRCDAQIPLEISASGCGLDPHTTCRPFARKISGQLVQRAADPPVAINRRSYLRSRRHHNRSGNATQLFSGDLAILSVTTNERPMDPLHRRISPECPLCLRRMWRASASINRP